MPSPLHRGSYSLVMQALSPCAAHVHRQNQAVGDGAAGRD
jgi:hypothetical protein